MCHDLLKPSQGIHPILAPLLALGAGLLATITGCGQLPPQPPETMKIPNVAIVRPALTLLHWTIRQPGSIEAFEETAIVPKIPGYVQKWNKDIGDRVKKGDVLAVLWIPDLVKELDQKRAEVEQARKMFQVVEAHVTATATLVDEAKAGVKRSRANLMYRQTQYDRVQQLLQRSVINKEVEDEALNELRAAEASVMEAEAKVAHAEADWKESQAVRDKTHVDIAVAQAALAKMQSLVDYATLSSPFDGVVTRRNINTGDFVQPPAATPKEPVYVVQRRDLVRVFVEIPEADAVWVKDGTPARIHIPSLKDQLYSGTVKRMAYALKRQTRTLLAEIDLPNPEDLLRPGMFVSAEITAERSQVLTLPTTAIATQGDVNEGYQDFCFLIEDGKLRRTPIEVGARGQGRVQVLKKKVQGTWENFTGTEAVALGELSSLADGQPINTATIQPPPPSPPQALSQLNR